MLQALDSGLLVIDFETAYDKKYSLSKMTTPEYVADKRFKLLGVALRYPDGRLDFRTDVRAAFTELQAAYGKNLDTVVVVCHNSYFDCFILNHVLGIRPPRLLDTMLFSYVVWGRRARDEYGRMEGASAGLGDLAQRYSIGAKGDIKDFCGLWDLDGANLDAMRTYGMQDANLTALLVPKLAADLTNTHVEFPLLAHTVKLYTERYVHVDLTALRALRAEVVATTNEFMAAAGVTLEEVGKNKQFVPLLEKALAATGRKIPLKEGKKGAIPATAKADPAMLALCADDDPIVSALANARVKRKSQDQLLARLDKIAAVAAAMHALSKDPTPFETAALGRVPVQLMYYGARTGRWAGAGGINFQNMGRTGFGKRIRNLIIPAPGCKFVVGDLASIEARVLAWVAGQAALLSAFEKGADIYSQFASVAFQTEVRKPKSTDDAELTKRLKALRGVGKITILGLGYGMGALKFINQLRGDKDVAPLFDTGVLAPLVCRGLVNTYRGQYPEIKALWAALEEGFKHAIANEVVNGGSIQFSNSRGCVLITLPSGRALRYPNARIEQGSKIIEYLDANGNVDKFEANGEQIIYGNCTGTYGGKITENIVQAIARDILAEAVLRCEALGRRVVLHCHDEILLEVPTAEADAAAADLLRELTAVPAWGQGLPLGAEVEVLDRYDK